MQIHVLVANEPRAYREAIAATLQVVRPNAATAIVEPADLDREVVRVAPHLVVCSAYSTAIHDHSQAWVMLYPDGGSGAVISIDGHRTTVPNIEFSCILELLDEVARRAA